jgi:hypothetical protein
VGSIPITRSSNQINGLAADSFRNAMIFWFLATKYPSSETRRNPPISDLIRRGLWRVCGKMPRSRISYQVVYPLDTLAGCKKIPDFA